MLLSLSNISTHPFLLFGAGSSGSSKGAPRGGKKSAKGGKSKSKSKSAKGRRR